MIKKYLLLPIFILLLTITLVACGGSTDSSPTADNSTVPAGTAETEALATTATTEANAVQPTAQNLSPVGPVQVVCTPVDIPENKAIAAVSNTDWSNGPADAPVTFIEYGDFQ